MDGLPIAAMIGALFGVVDALTTTFIVEKVRTRAID